ncbi:MAG: DUF1249 domain-containing protein [Bacteroidetes bacterium]|nr:DUF1249 domain-containing protein [Bacteroidota bacterium]
MAKSKQSKSDKNLGTQTWAREVVDIRENPKQNGIEIKFDAEPSPVLQPKLRTMGFRHSRVKSMWYGENTSLVHDFAEQLKNALPQSSDGPDLFLEPSFEAVKSNMEKKEFSFVMLSLGNGQTKNYLVFEPSKPKAEVIAGNFARQEFGDEFVSLAVFPKTRLKEARILFEEGKIISAGTLNQSGVQKTGMQKTVSHSSENKTANPETSETLNNPADNERHLVRQSLDKFYKWAVTRSDGKTKPSQVTREELTAWFKEHEPTLSDRTIESIWHSHQRITAQFNKGMKRSARSHKAPFDSIYKKIMQIIPGLLEHIKAGGLHGKSVKDPKGGLMDLNYDFVGNDKNGHPIIALSHYFKQHGDMVADPDMQIRLIPEMEIGEAMTFQDQFGFQQVYHEKEGKTYVDLKRRNSLNRFLNQWLSNLIRQGHRIDLSKDEDSDPLYYEKAFDLLTGFIPGLKKTGLKKCEGTLLIEGKGSFDKRIIHCRIAPWVQVNACEVYLTDTIDEKQQLNYDLEFNLDRKTAIVATEWLSDAYAEKLGRIESSTDSEEPNEDIHEEMTLGLIKWLEELVAEGYVLKLQAAEPGNQTSKHHAQVATHKESIPGLPGFDPRVMAKLIASEKYLANAWGITHSRDVFKNATFSSKESDDLRAFYTIYVLEDLEMQKKYKFLFENKDVPVLVSTAQIENPGSQGKSIATDLKYHDRHVPNVLVPKDTQEPFYSHLWELYDMKEVLKNSFPHLLKLRNANLDTATPIEMFELIQFSYPTDYGIPVDRSRLLREWEKRGKSIFKGIGFPTDETYPYVNLNLGYESIEPLNEILFDHNQDGDEWWTVAEHARPIADVPKAITIIKGMIEKEKRERKTYLNPKTGKPKGDHKKLARDAEFVIKYLEESLSVLQHYMDNPQTENTDEEHETKDPLTNDSGVYTKKTAGENLEEIEIPMPKGAQYSASISIAKTSEGKYRFGVNARKLFGDSSGVGFAPGVGDTAYPNRQEALDLALRYHKQRLETLLASEDSILDNEEKKNKQLTMALNALKKFAADNNVFLETATQQEEQKTSRGIIPGLEQAYWKQEDNKYPVDKMSVGGMEFNQARLREAIREKLQKLPLKTLEQIVEELSTKFTERRPLSSYEKGMVTIGKTGDKRKAALIAEYVDDMIIDNDLRHEGEPPVISFLIRLLFSGSAKLVDLPQKIEPLIRSAKPMKKQSQFELNKEIEELIDKKDKLGEPFSEEEKNLLRSYTGSGGLLKQGANDRGALYEYYTPQPVVQKMWDMAYFHGYDGGSVLEPAVGIGHFLNYAPKGANVVGYETNHYSARIAQILYPQAHIYEKAFETIFFAGNVHLKDKFENPGYSLVIGNPPYGEFTGRYAGMGEKQHTGATEYDQYFILRGLDVLKPGGLIVLLIPSNFLANQFKYNKVKEKIAAKAEFMDSYRLPGRIFQTTDIGTDILVLKKLK